MGNRKEKGLIYKKCWPRKNLGEVVLFLESIHPEGLSINVIGKEIGMTPGAVSNMFMKDNMRLSKAEEIARKYGYTLTLLFPTKTYPEGIEAPKHGRTFERAGNLAGLAMYIYDSRKTVNSVANEMGIWPTMLVNAMKTGDIFLDKLYKVTDHLRIGVQWIYEKNDEKTNNEKI